MTNVGRNWYLFVGCYYSVRNVQANCEDGAREFYTRLVHFLHRLLFRQSRVYPHIDASYASFLLTF